MGFPQNVADKVLVDCGRCCVLCHKFCGTKIELHHIIQVADGGIDTYDNCIPLCFDCHAEVKAYNSKHPKGRKYTEDELKTHRDKWYGKISNSIGIVYPTQIAEMDIVLYRRIKEILSEQNIPFLYHYDYHTEFDLGTSNTLNHFVDCCYDPTFEFIDADMEALKAKLLSTCNELIWQIAGHTSYSHERTALIIDDDIKISEKLHFITLSVKASFDDLIKLGRRKYGDVNN